MNRIEDNIVVVELDGGKKKYSKSLFPKEIEEGDVIIISKNLLLIDKEQTKKEKNIIRLMNDLW